MSIAFKNIPKDDQSVTTFKVYKSWEYTGTSKNRFNELYSSNIYLGTALKPNPDNYTGDLMSLDFDRESDTNDASRLLNTHLQNVPAGMLWYALKHKYFNNYNDFISFAGNAEVLNLPTNTSGWDGLTFTATTASLNKSYNYIEDKTNPLSSYRLGSIASVISIPQLKFGEEIKPGSFELIWSSSLITQNPSISNLKIIDDSKGNLHAYESNGSSQIMPGIKLNNRLLYLGFNESEYEKDISINNQSNPRYPTNIDYFNVSIVTASLIDTYDQGISFPYTIYNEGRPGFAAYLSSSYIRIDGTPSYFNPKINDDYTISFCLDLKSLPDLNKKQYLVTKRGLNRDYGLISRSGQRSAGNIWNLNENIFPYNIYIENLNNLYADLVGEISDGTTLVQLRISSVIDINYPYNITLTKTGNLYELWLNGGADGYDSATVSLSNITNKSDIFIGSFATANNDLNTPNLPLNGIIDEFQIFNTALTESDILAFTNGTKFGSFLNEPNIGKIFYKEGIAVINSNSIRFGCKNSFTGSGYLTTLPFGATLYNNSPNVINHNGIRASASTPAFSNLQATGSLDSLTVKWNSTVTIHEHEILCRIREDEFNVTLNPTILKKQENSYIPQDFTFSSSFTPYITTIGLYNEKAELLAIGKLANAIKKRPDVDLNIIIRYDL